MPSTESYGASSSELIGRIADVRYALTETSGTVQLYNQYGSIYEVPARVMPGELPIPAGERVVLSVAREGVGDGVDAVPEDESPPRPSGSP